MTNWIGTWACSVAAPVYFVPEEIMASPAPVSGTLRHRVRLSAGGERLRVRLSNEVGREPLQVGAISVAPVGGEGELQVSSLCRVTFGGHTGITLAPGAYLDSDPIALSVPELAQIDISVYFPQPFVPARSEGVHWARLGQGERVADAAMADGEDVAVRPSVTMVAVQSSRTQRAIVCLGDSLTDGAGTNSKEFRSWTDVLAWRLHERDGASMFGVVNAGIGGNQLNSELIGQPARQRMARDVFSVPGAQYLVVLVGTNDINVGGRTIEGVLRPTASFEAMTLSYLEIATRARARGFKVVGATLTPFKGSMFYLDEKDVLRQQVNHWLRNSAGFDALLDFDALLRDEIDPSRLRAEFDSGDGLHPNAVGQRTMGESVPLSLFV